MGRGGGRDKGCGIGRRRGTDRGRARGFGGVRQLCCIFQYIFQIYYQVIAMRYCVN